MSKYRIIVLCLVIMLMTILLVRFQGSDIDAERINKLRDKYHAQMLSDQVIDIDEIEEILVNYYARRSMFLQTDKVNVLLDDMPAEYYLVLRQNDIESLTPYKGDLYTETEKWRIYYLKGRSDCYYMIFEDAIGEVGEICVGRFERFFRKSVKQDVLLSLVYDVETVEDIASVNITKVGYADNYYDIYTSVPVVVLNEQEIERFYQMVKEVYQIPEGDERVKIENKTDLSAKNKERARLTRSITLITKNGLSITYEVYDPVAGAFREGYTPFDVEDNEWLVSLAQIGEFNQNTNFSDINRALKETVDFPKVIDVNENASYENVQELVEVWESTGYPKVINGVYPLFEGTEDTIVIVIGEKEKYEATIQEITAILKCSEGLAFHQGGTSYEHLQQMATEIWSDRNAIVEQGGVSPIRDVLISPVYSNGTDITEGKINKVIVRCLPFAYEYLQEKYHNQYGNDVLVEIFE